MTKQDLIAKIAKDTGSTRVSAAAAVDSMIAGITESLKQGGAALPLLYSSFDQRPNL